MNIKHFAVMKDTGEIIAEGNSYRECQHAAFATRRWCDPNTREFMPAGSNPPYHILTEGQLSCAQKLRDDLAKAEQEITEESAVSGHDHSISPLFLQVLGRSPRRDPDTFTVTGRAKPKFEPKPGQLPKEKPDER